MIAPIKKLCRKDSVPAWHAGFLSMLPLIVRHARMHFRHLNPEARTEAVAECLANALVAYVRLVELDKVSLAYPTVLARYAVAQVRDGRRVGGKLNIRDVLSAYCQRQKKVVVERLDRFDEEENQWREVLVEDKNAGPADTAAIRMDFTAWLRALPSRRRRITKVLANGEATNAVARKFSVSPARVSQIRGELCRAWHAYQGEMVETPVAARAVA
jgi:hypothetical protein